MLFDNPRVFGSFVQDARKPRKTKTSHPYFNFITVYNGVKVANSGR